MDLLVIGDLHIGQSGTTKQLPSSVSQFDAVLLVGDIAHRGLTQRAEPFIEALNAEPPPVYVVPGNHDWRELPDILAKYKTVHNIDRQVCTLPSGRPVIGLGSRIFDEGPEVRKTSSEESEIPLWQRVHHQLCLRDTSSVPRPQQEWYCRRHARLLWLTRQCELPPVILSHPPPYGTELDMMQHSNQSEYRNWGSMALRQSLATVDVEFLACGHIHESVGYDKVSHTTVLNAGYRTNWHVQINETTDILGRVPSQFP